MYLILHENKQNGKRTFANRTTNSNIIYSVFLDGGSMNDKCTTEKERISTENINKIPPFRSDSN